MLDLIHILLELLIFCLDLVILGQILNLTSFEPQHKHVNFLHLVRGEPFESLGRIRGLIHHGLMLDPFLQLCSFLFQVVVVIL